MVPWYTISDQIENFEVLMDEPACTLGKEEMLKKKMYH